MQSQNIFIGTIKKCKNLYWYEKYGDEHYFGDFQIGHCEIGTIYKYVDILLPKGHHIDRNSNFSRLI